MNEEERRQLFASIADYLAAMRPVHPVRPLSTTAPRPVRRCPTCGCPLPDGGTGQWVRCRACGQCEDQGSSV